jgi:hypothetical protein
MGKAKGQEQVTRPKTSVMIPDRLPQELKFAAPEERTDVSALLGRLTERHLKARRGGRQ